MLNDQEIEQLFEQLRHDWDDDEDVSTEEHHKSLKPETYRDFSDYFQIGIDRLRIMSGREMRLLELEYGAYGDKAYTFEAEQAAEDLGREFRDGIERCGDIVSYLKEWRRNKQKKEEVNSPILPKQKYR